MINLIVVHCAATKPSMDIGAADIRKWHLDRGWSDIGYHYVIKRNGDVEKGRNDKVQGAHAKGYNRDSLGVCLVGGIDDDGKSSSNFTRNQYKSLEQLLTTLEATYEKPDIVGHSSLDSGKDCPCFDIKSYWYGS